MLNKVILFLFVCCLFSPKLWAENGSDWHLVKEFPQKSFPKTVPAGNYSGLTHLHDDVYAVVSDKSDSALFFRFQIQVNLKTGELEQVRNLGFSQRIHPQSLYTKENQAAETGYDLEAIAKVSDSTVVVSSEGKAFLKEYFISPSDYSRHSADSTNLWERKYRISDFYPNYLFESLAYDSLRKCLWTISESTMRQDGTYATTKNGVANRLRLVAFDWSHGTEHPQKFSYAYRMDPPSTRRDAQIYVMGVSELCVLEDGQLLVLEREAYIPKAKVGAFCICKLYLVNPDKEKLFPDELAFSDATPYMKKTLLTEWRTHLSLLGRSFANYEGMCLGPKLENGDQVLILVSDSQNQYAGVLKDWFKTIVISQK